MEILGFSETLVSTYEPTQHQNPEEQYLHLHHHANFESHTFINTRVNHTPKFMIISHLPLHATCFTHLTLIIRVIKNLGVR
jgi:hypothetical protein